MQEEINLNSGDPTGKETTIEGGTLIADFWRKFSRNRMAVLGAILIVFLVLIAIFGPMFTTHGPREQIFMVRQSPSRENWFGTDNFGRDIFTRIIHGMRITMFVGFSSVFMGMTVGVFLGIISGYYGSITDTIIMRLMDIMLAFPGILLALAIVSILDASIGNVIIAVALFSVPVFARISRGSTLEVRQLEYIEAVKALGAGDLRIIFGHILPNILSPIIVQATLNIATAILTASGLSFLGMGAQPPSPEWGAMLNDGRNYLWNAPHIATIPGIAIMVVVLAFNIFGDGLRDALDPKSKN